MAWPSWLAKATNFLGWAAGFGFAESSVAEAVAIAAVALDAAAFANLAAFALLPPLPLCSGFRFGTSTAWNHTMFAGGQSGGYERRGLPCVWLVVWSGAALVAAAAGAAPEDDRLRASRPVGVVLRLVLLPPGGAAKGAESPCPGVGFGVIACLWSATAAVWPSGHNGGASRKKDRVRR